MEITITALEQRIASIADLMEKSDSLDILIREIWPRHLDRALALAEEARDLAQAADDPFLLARALDTFGYLLWQKAAYPRAMTMLLEALNLARTVRDGAREASVLNTMASISSDLGNYPDSLDYYYKALAIAQTLDDTALQTCILNDIGSVYLLIKDPDEALVYLRKSLSISQEYGYKSVGATALDRLGQAYYQLGDYEESLLYAQHCQSLARQAGLLHSEIDVLITMGKTYAALGQLGQALSRFNDALSLAREAGKRPLEVKALVEMGRIYIRQKDLNRALARLGTALNIADDIGQKQALYDIHAALADIYVQSGDHRRALEHYQQFHALKEEVFNSQADHRIKSMQVAHEVEQTRHQSEIYQLKNVELQQQIDERLIADLDAFSSMVAHDLKSPLSVITANAELIVRDENTTLSAYSSEYLKDLLQMGYKMGRVIDDLLTLAGVRRADIAIAPVTMESIVCGARKRLATLIKKENATLIVPDEWPAALGHAGLVEEVWANYISNALKYGGDPPVVELGATAQPDGMICCWVQDNGDGINPDQQHRLFTEYTRLDRTCTNGHGLGLTIVKRIVNRLGGDVGITSTGIPGEGCRFTFTLPAAAEPLEIA